MHILHTLSGWCMSVFCLLFDPTYVASFKLKSWLWHWRSPVQFRLATPFTTLSVPGIWGDHIEIHLRLGELDDLIRALKIARRHRRGCVLDYLADQFRLAVKEPLYF